MHKIAVLGATGLVGSWVYKIFQDKGYQTIGTGFNNTTDGLVRLNIGAFSQLERFVNSERPDLIINLPEGKHLIIDSKVSLTAYVNYFNAESNDEKEQYLDQHIKSISSHIDLLADKNYQTLAGLNSPDYRAKSL